MSGSKKNLTREKNPDGLESCGDRLLKLLDILNITKTNLADQSGVTVTTVSKYCESDVLPGGKVLSTLVRKYRVRVEWILNGSEPIFSNSGASPQLKEGQADYKAQILELTHELAAKDRELAAVELAKGKQQSLIFEAVRQACREQGLSPEQTRAIQWAVMDYEGALDQGRAVADDAASHRSAVGD